MNRISNVTVGIAAALLAAVGSSMSGCNAIVGSGDYSVGQSDVEGGASGEGGLRPASGTAMDGSTTDGSTKPASGDSGMGSTGFIGDPCVSNSGCAAALLDVDAGPTCNGTWCTASCTQSATCGSNSAGTLNACVQNVCFPGCNADTDCTAYSGTTCQQLVAGSAMVCAPSSAAGGTIGDPCSVNADCAKGTCNGDWCTEACAPAIGCGSDSSGELNYCVENGNNQYICFPGCTKGGDCKAYGGTTCQPIAGATTGSICSAPATGLVGDPCTMASDCTIGTCESGIVWCTESCKVDADCGGPDSAGNPTYCVKNGNNQFICFPGCTTNADC